MNARVPLRNCAQSGVAWFGTSSRTSAQRSVAFAVTEKLVVAVALCVLGSGAGLWLSYLLELPTGPLIVMCLGGVWLLSLVFGPRGVLRGSRLPARHLRG